MPATQTKQPKIYVGCALTHASEKFIAQVVKFKENLRASNYEVLDFLGLHAGSPANVYRNDIERCVGSCDAFIAICDYPSLGVGYELNEAVHLRIPILVLADQKTKLTRLLLGAAEVKKNVFIDRYTDLDEDAATVAIKWLETNLVNP